MTDKGGKTGGTRTGTRKGEREGKEGKKGDREGQGGEEGEKGEVDITMSQVKPFLNFIFIGFFYMEKLNFLNCSLLCLWVLEKIKIQ